MERDELIKLCECARVPESKWKHHEHRRSAMAQEQVNELHKHLSAGRDYRVITKATATAEDYQRATVSTPDTWWVGVTHPRKHRPDESKVYYYSVPTAACLYRHNGEDWA